MKLLVAALAAVSMGIMGVAGATEGLGIESVDVERFPTVSVVVALPAAVVASDPAADDFAVLVDGERVSADVFALVRDPIEIVLAIDTSGSMRGEPLLQAASGARGFIEALPSTANVAVLTFGSDVTVRSAMGDPTSDAAESLASVAADGETALYDALATAAAQFSVSDARRVLVVMSDGGDTASSTSLDNASAALDAVEAEVWAVALETPETDRRVLERLASSGSLVTVSDAAALAAAYEGVVLELTGRYRLTFSAAAAAGAMQIDVFVRSGDGVLGAAQTIDLGTGTVSSPLSARSAPVGFDPSATSSVATVAAELGGFAGAWALPVGVVLVFLGAAIGLWLTARDDGAAALDQPGEAVSKRGLLTAMGDRARSIGDRVAGRANSGAMDLALDKAGLALRPGEFVVVSATVALVGVVAGLVMAGAVGAVLVGSLAAAAPRTMLRTMAERRRRAFADQLEGTLQTIAGSLRSGYGLVQAMSTVAAEAPSPTADEFNRAVVENRLGRSVEESLSAIASRLDNEDLRWVVEAIAIQHEVGGNLAEVLDTVTDTIRDRNQIRRQVKALSAEGRMSAIILLALPFVIAAFIAMVSPDYLSELTGTMGGRVMLGIAGLLMVAGGAWIKKIVTVEF